MSVYCKHQRGRFTGLTLSFIKQIYIYWYSQSFFNVDKSGANTWVVLRNKYFHLIGSRRRGQFPSYSVHFSPEATYDSLQLGGSSRGQGSRRSDLKSAKSSIIRHQEKAQSQFVSFNEIRQFLPVEIAETRSRKNIGSRVVFSGLFVFRHRNKSKLERIKRTEIPAAQDYLFYQKPQILICFMSKKITKKIPSYGCNSFSRPSETWKKNSFHLQKASGCHNVILFNDSKISYR